jgi:cyclophilin family peptidyl-prolyl cis-trans isomerase
MTVASRTRLTLCLIAISALLAQPAAAAKPKHQGPKQQGQGQGQQQGGQHRTLPSPNPAPNPANPMYVIETSKGDIKIELWPDKAPLTVKAFVDYVEKKQYDGTIFHKVIPNFILQAGGYDAEGKERAPDLPGIPNESSNGMQNRRGTLGWARKDEPNDPSSQFFINVVDNRFIDGDIAPNGNSYAVFGQVVDGMKVVDRIRGVRTQRTRISDSQPVEAVVIKSIHKAQ